MSSDSPPLSKIWGAVWRSGADRRSTSRWELAASDRLPARVETALFRITQEALTNVVKHADAKTVQITFARGKPSVVLTINDDGRGFSRAQVAGDQLGLVGMRERAASVNGALDIESKPGAGTRLTVEIPLS
jgi:signal transduction histidine kinase